MRKAFNFYNSYWEVACELSDKDRLSFYDALMKRQFTGIESELNGMAKFAYLSQKHSIDKQIKGYLDKTKDDFINPTEPPCQDPTEGCTEPPCQQEKGQEKGKEKEKSIIHASKEANIDFDAFILFFNKSFNKKVKTYPRGVKEKYKLRLKEGFTKDDFKHTILNLKEDSFAKEQNYKYVTLEYISRPKTLEMFSHIPSVQNNVVHTNIELN